MRNKGKWLQYRDTNLLERMHSKCQLLFLVTVATLHKTQAKEFNSNIERKWRQIGHPLPYKT